MMSFLSAVYSAWLDEGLHEVVARVNQRASLFTGLDKDQSEFLQVCTEDVSCI